MKRFNLILFSLLATLMAFQVYGAPSFSVRPPSRVYEGQKFAVTFRLDNGEGSDLRVAQINGCTLLFGPSTSHSSSYSIVNGRASSSTRVEYTYTYRADKAGTFTIPEASVVCDGKRLTSRAVKFTVEPAANADRPASSRPSRIDDADTQTSDRPVNPSDIFVRISLSRTSVYEQEAIECTIKLYTTYNIQQFMATKQPMFDGFLIQEVDVQPALNTQETLNGRTYLTAILKKCIIFPQKPGKLTINSGNYDVSVIQYDNISMGGMMVVRQPRQRDIKISSNSASVDVRPLPTPRPDGFTGAVGTFSVESKLVGNNFRTNDPATLIYTIRGTGNIKYLKEPQIDFPTEFELYTPQSDIQAIVSGPNVMGTMTIDYTFVPQSVGKFTIGGNKFVYFDPAKGQYVTLSTPSYDLNVAKGAAQATSADQQAIAAKNTDILHIVRGPKPATGFQSPVVDTVWFWLLWAMLAAGLTAYIIYNRINLRLNADVEGRRLARAGKIASKRLAKARKLTSNPDAFYQEALTALNGFLADKLLINPSQLSRESIDERLAEAGASEPLRQKTAELLDRCEMARYTPGSSEAQAVNSLLTELTDTINQIQNLKISRR